MKYFSTYDAKSGFHQIPMHPADAEKTAFTSIFGLYEFIGMPMGLTNAPASFQRLMNALLAGLTWQECLVFVDDIIIFSETFDEHLAATEHMFERLAGKISLSGKKSQIVRASLIFLGHVVSRQGLGMDPHKHEAVSSRTRPTNQKEMMSWLGLGNWYRKFIKDYSKLIRPLLLWQHEAANVKSPPWTPECEEAFQEMKRRLTSAPILAWPDMTQPFEVYTDASLDGLGATLEQKREGKNVVICYGRAPCQHKNGS